MAESNLVTVAYIEETTFGEVPAGPPTLKKVRRTGGSFAAGLDMIQSQEVRSDRQVTGVGLARIAPNGSIDVELSYGAHDDLIAGAMMSAWEDTAESTTGSLTVASGTFTLTGAFTNFVVGQSFKVAGSSSNDGLWTITVKTDSDNVDAVSAETGAAPTDEGPTASVTIDTEGTITPGTTRNSFVIEEEYGGLTVSPFMAYLGMVIGSMSLDIAPESIITGSFGDLQGMEVQNNAATVGDGSPTEAAQNDVLSSVSDVTGIVESDTDRSTLLVSGLNFQLQNNIRGLAVIGSGGKPGDIRLGQLQVTGGFNTYWGDGGEALVAKFLAFSTVSLRWVVKDLAGNQYVFSFPGVKLSGPGTPEAGGSDTDVPLNLGFNAFRDPSQDITMRIDRFAA